ncbi:hypothetical protein Ctob_011453 [Chrysochromulina tobinii]|uniref:Uncharacterized protein n=1 Tax=Chrysochromulina tobinii TaxID=1460289 RepID=A0A0M0JW22_9EUKA|nr:hypothetical protein Ctob_011453 [Chrysochromulina tobinii]|eukprot:KOO30774.1 hypothetical protein Ctob_011453 [Chrysochromulina sp. CCMP291]
MTAADVRTVARATTDADGIATIAADQLTEPVGRGASFHLLVASTLPSAHGGAQNGAHDGASELLVLPDISFDHTSLALPHGGIVASLLIDRAVYKPNDTVRAAAWIWVRCKGYVRWDDGRGRLLVPSVARDAAFARLSFKLQVHWTDGANSMRSGQLLGMQGASSGEDLGEVVVQLDGVYASFDASLRVPPNARYGEHSIMLLQSDSSGVGYVDAGSSYGGTRTLTSALLAVADPRPPTVELTVSTPGTRHLPPNGTVLLKADGEEDGDEDGEGVGGEEQVLTGDDGEATLHWRPARRDGRPVELTKLGALGGAAVGGRRVRLSLHRVPEGEEEEEDGERSTSAARKMADEDGDEPRQWLQNVPPAMLPSFVTAPASEAARPPSCVLDTTSLGAVRVTNPFQSAELRALLIWGNALAVRHLVSPALPPGGTTTHVQLPPLGDECKHDCTVDVTLIAASELGRRLPVPTSALFDETAPMLHRYSLELRVDAPPPPLQLELTVGSPVVAPGANASVIISLTDANGMPISEAARA